MLTTERILLRRFEARDREPFAAINADPEVMRYFPTVLTREETAAMLEQNEAHLVRHGFGFYAVELRDSGEFAGFIGLWAPSFDAHFTPCVEIGWRLAARFWNRGLGTEGARALLHYGFGALGLGEIVSFTTEGNLPSRRVMEKLGMRRDPADDFEHPRLPEGHPLRPHVLYRLRPG
ncbi:MAG: GNAT family N-acetyltransferase [Bryobacteraceae bacterium]|nr:GNAT family N-acetyltransferase [Bryobacteraceae bacterium]